MKAYPYQERAVARMWQVMMQSRARSLLLVSPTGSGKTVVAAKFIRRALRQRKRIVFVAHTAQIIDQTYETLLACGVPEFRIGVLMAADERIEGHADRKRDGAPIQICGIATLARRDLAPRADVVIVDEAHHAEANSYKTLIGCYPRARIFGLTATPARADRKPMRDTFGALYVIATPTQLIKARRLADPVVYSAGAGSKGMALLDAQLKGVRRGAHDYNQKQLGQAMNHRVLVGNIIKEWKRLGEGRRTVVFASGIAHSKAIVARFKAAGVAAEHIDGEMNAKDPNKVARILERLDSGELTVVSNYAVLAEGWDQPSVKCIVLARPTRSLTTYLQMTGRSSRPYKGQRPIVLDHAGNCWRHSLPFIDREWSLDAPPKADGDAPLKSCSECEAVIAAGHKECPECGHAFPRVETPQEIEERLVKVERDALRRRIEDLAAKRGFSQKWVQNVAAMAGA